MTYYLRRSKFNSMPPVKVFRSMFGFGFTSSQAICRMMGVKGNVKLSVFSQDQLAQMEIRFDKRFISQKDFKNFYGRCLREYIKHGTYRGIRLSNGLPSHGQRTRTNSQTSKRFRFRRAKKHFRRT